MTLYPVGSIVRLMMVFSIVTSCRLTIIGGGLPMTEKNSYKEEIKSLSSDKVLYRLISTINNAWNKGLNETSSIQGASQSEEKSL